MGEIARELKKLDSSVNYGSKKDLKGVGLSTSKC